MDGVLIDSHPVHKKVWAQFLASLNRPVSEAELDFVLDGRKREEIMRHFLGNVPAEQMREYGQRKDEIYAESSRSLKTIPGVEEFLGTLGKAGLPLGVATSASLARARGTLDELGILPRFAALVTANDVVNGKPDPEIFVKAAERLGVAADSLLVVEDAVSGVRAAKSAGMKCLGIAADGRKEKLRAAGADHVVPDFLGLSLVEVQRLFCMS
jgi:HAD superfamily hydrolase (TIGR01509 family)